MSLSRELANILQGSFPQLNADQCVNLAAQLKLLIERSLTKRRKFATALMIRGGKERRLGAVLRELRMNAGHTQESTAQELEWQPSKIHHIENGTARLSLTDLWALLHLYGVDDPGLKKRLEDLARAVEKRR